MRKFRCWDPEMQEEDEGTEIEAGTAATAAEKFCEQRYSRDSYPQHRTIHVRALNVPLEVKVFEVETRTSPEFLATEKR